LEAGDKAILLVETEVVQLRHDLASVDNIEQHNTCVQHKIALARALLRHYQYTGSLESIEECVLLYRGVMDTLGGDSSNTTTAHVVLELVQALQNRFAAAGITQDVEEMINLSRHVFEATPYDRVLRATTLRSLGIALRSRSEYATTRKADVEEASLLHSQALELASPEDVDYYLTLTTYARILVDKFSSSANPKDLERAQTLIIQALNLCPPGHLDRARVLSTSGSIAAVRYDTGGRRSDLQESVWLYAQALKIHGPRNASAHALCGKLSLASRHLYVLTSELTFLDIAMEFATESLRYCPRGSRIRTQLSDNLATALFMRYQSRGDQRDLARMSEMLRETVRQSENTDKTSAMSNLAISLIMYYLSSGNVADLEESVELQRQILEVWQPGHTMHAAVQNNLSKTLHLRFRRLGDEEDLNEAIDRIRVALECYSSDEDPRVEASRGVLALVLTDRYHHSNATQDLNEAILLLETNIKQGSRDHHAYIDTLMACADAYVLLFRRTHCFSDLEQATELYSKALDVRPEGHVERYQSLAAVAQTSQLHFEFHGNMKDAVAALDLTKQALVENQLGLSGKAQVLFLFAQLHCMPSSGYQDPHVALEYFIDAISDESCESHKRLTEALGTLEALEVGLSKLPAMDNHLRECLLYAYQQVAGLLPRVAYFGLDARARLRALRQADGMASVASEHLLLLGRPNDAVEMLEEGRGVFWSQFLRLRTTFEALPGDLSTSLKDVSRQLEIGSLQEGVEAASSNLSKLSAERAMARRRELGVKFDALVQKARNVPGFERFMLHDHYSAIAQAAAKGPVVILLGSNTGCHAIIIRSSSCGAEHVDLPDITKDRLQMLSSQHRQSVTMGRLAFQQRAMKRKDAQQGLSKDKNGVVYEELWEKVMSIIMARLGFQVLTNRIE
jgi:tetratricopeptide (TPR) repeat protein